MNGDLIEKNYLITLMEREIERTKSFTTEDAIKGMKHMLKVVDKIIPTINLDNATRLLYENPDARLVTGEKVITLDKASDILNGAFKEVKNERNTKH